MRMIIVAVTAIQVALALSAAPAAAADYRVDVERSELVVRLEKAGLAAAFAHDHVIQAAAFEGSIAWDPERPEAARVRVRADARSLVADPPELREKYGLSTDLADKDRREIQATMESEEQLGVEQHPEIVFESTAVRGLGNGAIEVTGILELHGGSRELRFEASPSVEQGTLRAEAEIIFLQSDYGIEPYSAMLGAVRNRDRATLIVHLVAETISSPDDGSQRVPEALPGESAQRDHRRDRHRGVHG